VYNWVHQALLSAWLPPSVTVSAKRVLVLLT